MSGWRGECRKWWGLKEACDHKIFVQSTTAPNFWLFHKLCLDFYRVEEMRVSVEEMRRRVEEMRRRVEEMRMRVEEMRMRVEDEEEGGGDEDKVYH